MEQNYQPQPVQDFFHQQYHWPHFMDVPSEHCRKLFLGKQKPWYKTPPPQADLHCTAATLLRNIFWGRSCRFSAFAKLISDMEKFSREFIYWDSIFIYNIDTSPETSNGKQWPKGKQHATLGLDISSAFCMRFLISVLKVIGLAVGQLLSCIKQGPGLIVDIWIHNGETAKSNHFAYCIIGGIVNFGNTIQEKIMEMSQTWLFIASWEKKQV